MPYMMAPGEDKIVADAVYEGLTHPGHYENPVIPQGAPVQIAGNWTVAIKYLRGTGEQRFTLQQEGDRVTGTQTGEVYKAELKGLVQADHIELTSDMPVSGNSIFWTFRGIVSGNNASGTVHMGEYGRRYLDGGKELVLSINSHSDDPERHGDYRYPAGPALPDLEKEPEPAPARGRGGLRQPHRAVRNPI